MSANLAESYPDEREAGSVSIPEQQITIDGVAKIIQLPERTSSVEYGNSPDRYRTDALDQFMDKVGKVDLLTAAEEVALAQRIEAGDPSAKKQMIEANLRLVIHYAEGFQGLGLDLIDLIQEGSLGLIKAVERFDWRRGNKFSTYATPWIIQALQRGTANKGETIRLPVHVVTRRIQLSRASGQLTAQLGRQPTKDELAKETSMQSIHLDEALDAVQVVASLDQTIDAEGEIKLMDAIAADSDISERIIDQLDTTQREQAISEILERLASLGPEGQKTAKILTLRFGLGGEEPMTLAKIADEVGVSRSRVRQIEGKILEDLAGDDALREITRDDDNFEGGAPSHSLGHPTPLIDRMKPVYVHPKLQEAENIILGKMIDSGANKKTIAKETGLAASTIKEYMLRVKNKLEATDYADAVRIARQDLGLSQ